MNVPVPVIGRSLPCLRSKERTWMALVFGNTKSFGLSVAPLKAGQCRVQYKTLGREPFN
jgi:hypothetical protein